MRLNMILVAAFAAFSSAAAQNTLKVELVEMNGALSTAASELPPSFSPDGKIALWSVSTPLYARWIVILQSELRSGRWQTPTVAPFSGQWVDADPFFTEDGKRLYFLSRRPRDAGGTQPERGYRIWYVDRVGNGWSKPVPLPSHINNGDMHYVTPVRSGALYIAGIRQDSGTHGDLYRIPLVNGAWGEPINLGSTVNSLDDHETTPYVTPDESWMIYATSRDNGVGGLDLFISFRDGEGWSAPKLLPEPINSRVRDFCPIVSPDGKWLYFSSDRGFSDKPLNAPVDYAEVQRMLSSPGNSVGDVYRTSVADLLAWARKGRSS